jgi:hypothetical protein
MAKARASCRSSGPIKGELMLGFELDFWDYATFAIAALAGAAVILVYIWIAELFPGRIALARGHPEAEAVKLMGRAGLLPTMLPWIQAFIWAFKLPVSVQRIKKYSARRTLIFIHL